MNELQVKTLTIEPAKIEFNFEDIEKELDTNLVKYQNLTFTEGSTADLRKVLAELRKGKKAVDRYRIDTKKELNQPVLKFEEKIKELNSKFDSVINPLDKQLKEYVQRERDEKLKQCEEIRERLINEYELEEEYASQVEIMDQFLTKSASISQVEESLEFKVKNLKMEQDQKVANIEIIKTNVKLANSENDLSLSTDAYVRLLEISSVDSVKQQIEIDANNEVARREHAERQKAVELERIEQEVKESVEIEKNVSEQPANKEFEQVPISNAPESVSIDDLPFTDVDIPFANMADPFAEEPIKITKTYEVIGTREQLKQVESTLSKIGVEWIDIDE